VRAGLIDVVTYIQSGNLVFDFDDGEAAAVAVLADVLRANHGLSVPVVARTAAQLAEIADRHPAAGGEVERRWLHVHFLDRSVDPAVADRIDPAEHHPDTFVIDGRQIYATYPTGSGRSTLTVERFERAFGVVATARNLNTVRALADLAARR
jgi:uncharacterized protein (DUF1697 family)